MDIGRTNDEAIDPDLVEAPQLQVDEVLAGVLSLTEGLFTVDRDNRITFMNPAAEAMTGWSLADALGKPSGIVFHVLNGITGEPSWQPIAPAIREDRPYTLLPNTLLRRKDMTEIPIEDRVSPIHDAHGAVVGAVITFRDIASSHELLRLVLERVHRDALTSLPDRALLGERFKRQRSSKRQNASGVALLYLDLDNFKQINDTFGHLAGDFVLQTTAQRLCATVPESGTVYRLGGDELVVLLEQVTSLEPLHQYVDEVLRSVREPMFFSGTRLDVTLSLGVSVHSRGLVELQDLLGSADQAMYRAKHAGGDRAEWNNDLAGTSPSASSVPPPDVMGHAFAEENILLHYQPVVELATGSIVGAEALTRCRRPQTTPLLPADLISKAEHDGTIVHLGQIVLRQALRDQARWRDRGLKQISMHVNVSAVELLNPSYLYHLDRILEEEAYMPGCVILELTETAQLHSEHQRKLVKALTERGLLMAIDDFGVGYSNLSYLRHFPISVIKIDREFLKAIPDSKQDADIVRAMIAMAHSLHCRVVAEGVETEAQRLFLQGMDCAQGQGFFFSPAVTPDHFLSLLEADELNASARDRAH